MLETELDALTELKVGFLAVEAPNDVAGGAVDLADGAGVASGDEVVAQSVFVNGADVEVVPGVRGVETGAGLAGVDWKDGFGRGDEGEAEPLKEEAAGGEVEFCYESISTAAGAREQNNELPWKMALTIHCCSGEAPHLVRSRGTGR